MTRNEQIRALQEEYTARRARNEAERDARAARAEQLDPEIARLRRENQEAALGTMKIILSLKDDAARREAAERLRDRGIANNAAIRARLRALGLPEDELELHYRCPVCRDTGYVGEAPSRFCECFEDRLRQLRYADGTMAAAAEQRFDTFDLSRFPEEGGQRELMRNLRIFCERYADRFPDTEKPNLLLTGAGGLGKTFLLNCVYERVTARGHAALRVTAFRMLEAMRRRHFGEEDGEEDLGALVESPLLLIDDLGSEPMMRNITVEYLFNLLNERIARRLHTVIATNLDPVQLQNRYGERVSSRLLDRTVCSTVLLKGKDLRTL